VARAARIEDEPASMINDHSDNGVPAQVQRKKAYEEPKLVRVSLRPDEAVLGHCKISGSAGPAGASCSALGGCMVPGS
jgi:hypothetical protein